jgi:hypothetical protein
VRIDRPAGAEASRSRIACGGDNHEVKARRQGSHASSKAGEAVKTRLSCSFPETYEQDASEPESPHQNVIAEGATSALNPLKNDRSFECLQV